MNDFERKMAKKSVQELINILAIESDYLPEAIKAVRQELHRRKLSPVEMNELKEIENKNAKKSRVDLNEPIQQSFNLSGLGCGQIGCIMGILLFLFFILIAICSDPSPSHYKNRDDEVLTDEEFENKPYDELTEEEKKQAVERIGKDLGIDQDDK